MIEPWKDCIVADIASSDRNALVGGPFGSNLVSKDYVDNGVPVIRGQNMATRWCLVTSFSFQKTKLSNYPQTGRVLAIWYSRNAEHLGRLH